MSDIANRPEPPRMNRRHKVLHKYNPGIESWKELATMAEALRYAGLVAELDVESNVVELYAARRVKGGKRGE